MSKKKGPGIWAVDQSTHKQNDLELFESGILADVEVKCGDHTWKLHKAILCTRSVWFKNALTGAFEESNTRIVTLDEEEQLDVDCFLRFIYTGSVDLQKSYPRDDTFVALMRIWKMADFFINDSLRNLAVRAAKDHAQEHAKAFCTAFPGADHDKEMDSIIKDSFNPAVSLLYGEEMSHLKSKFLPIYMGLAAASVHRLSNNEAFQNLLHKFPQFAADWATSLMKGFNIWNPLCPERAGGLCNECGKDMGGRGTVDTLKWVRNVRLMVLCDRYYRMPDLAEWAGAEEAKKTVKLDCLKKKKPILARREGQIAAPGFLSLN
ncbi:hypothetical protein SLS64_010959 [Diaporthe eres]|uniref:BTB domain-containing protein n=1 Tax=Diaporthe eres TaxID=83184 RepID=A0ABR1NN53_DIAER